MGAFGNSADANRYRTGGEQRSTPTITVAGLKAGGDGVVNKLIAKTPIKIEQELKQENENEQKQEVTSGGGDILALVPAGSAKRWELVPIAPTQTATARW